MGNKWMMVNERIMVNDWVIFTDKYNVDWMNDGEFMNDSE